MPFKSQAQRGFMFAKHPKIAKEFEGVTPLGAQLPEHVAKMAKGGEAKPFNGVKDSDNGTLVGLRELLRQAAAGKQASEETFLKTGVSPTPKPSPQQAEENMLTGKGYADGGDVQPPMDQNFMNQLNAGTAMTPPPAPVPNPIAQASQSAQAMPPTNPSIYQGISADDRNALMQKLIAQKTSPGMMAASGAAGLGDAITSAFGKTPTNAQGNLRTAQQQNIEQRTGAMDTQRTQRTQDMQAQQEQQLNDPNSPMSQAMRETFISAGVKVPSQMPGNVMMKIAPDLGNLAFKQASLAETHLGHTIASQDFEAGLAQTKASSAANIANQQKEREQKQQELNKSKDVEAASHWMLSPALANQARNRLAQGAGTSDASQTSLAFPDPNKEAKYQAWKASQGQ